MAELTHNIGRPALNKDNSEMIDLIANEVMKRIERKQLVDQIMKSVYEQPKEKSNASQVKNNSFESVAYDLNSIRSEGNK